MKLGDDTISRDELMALRSKVNGMTDEELDALLKEIDASSGRLPDVSPSGGIDDESVARVKEAIDANIGYEDCHGHTHGWIRKCMAVAAALLPLFIATTIYFYINRSDGAGHEYELVTVGNDDGIDITLADGTTVSLNRDSRLSVSSRFTPDNRVVDFSGEGYFDVAHDSLHPFEIRTEDVNVRVLGTSFSLSSGKNFPFTSVSLYDGRVELTSVATSRSITITPGQRAVFNKDDMTFTVDSMPDAQLPYWVSGLVRYHNVSPDSLVASVEEIYDITLDPAVASAIDERFTGTLPADNFSSAMSILSRIYGFPLPYDKKPD